MPVLDALNRKSGFTQTEEILADYVIAHADEVARMGISDLAAASFTSNAAIVRLCQKLELKGYREFRLELVGDLERMRNAEREVNPDTPFLEGQSTRDIVSSIANLTRQAVADTNATISTQQVQRAARLILGARRVAIYGVGDSAISGAAFANLLLKIGITCFMADQYGDPNAVSSALGPGDAALAISYSGRMFERQADVMDIVRSRGCKLIAVTSDDTLRERMADVSCLVLLPTGESLRDKIATYYAQSAVRFALDCIYGECFARNYAENVERVSRYDDTRPGLSGA